MWRYMIVISLVLGAVLPPPEVVTQVLMAGPLYLLYEITVWIAWYWEQPDRAKARRALLLLVLAVLLFVALAWAAPALEMTQSSDFEIRMPLKLPLSGNLFQTWEFGLLSDFGESAFGFS